MKTIKIDETTHKKLYQLKLSMADKTLSETINNLIKWFNWWQQPGKGRGKGDGNKQQ